MTECNIENTPTVRGKKVLNELKAKYPEKGQFDLEIGQDIVKIVKIKDVPNGYGIYLIYEGHGCRGNPIYIGKSGTMRSGGNMSAQGIGKRLGTKQDGIYRTEFFIKEMEKRKTGLSFAWFITFDNSELKTLPANAEADVMQKFYDMHGRLPELNKNY